MTDPPVPSVPPGSAATPPRPWRLRPRCSVRQLLVSIALLAIPLAAVIQFVEARHLRWRAATSRALFQPKVDWHARDAEQSLESERRCKDSMYVQARELIEDGAEFVQYLRWGSGRPGEHPDRGRRHFGWALLMVLRMEGDLVSLARSSDRAAWHGRDAAYHTRAATDYARLIREGCTEERRRPLDLEIQRLGLEAEHQRLFEKDATRASGLTPWYGWMADDFSREADHYARLARGNCTQEERWVLKREAQRLSGGARHWRLWQGYHFRKPEQAAWHGRMAAYYEREAARWARLLREGRTDQGPGPRDLEEQRRFEAEERAHYPQNIFPGGNGRSA